jgi:hypothetical protein
MEWAVTPAPGMASQGTVSLDTRHMFRADMHTLLRNMRLVGTGLPRMVTAWPALAMG